VRVLTGHRSDNGRLHRLGLGMLTEDWGILVYVDILPVPALRPRNTIAGPESPSGF
jgi:hypothetical protein